MQGNQQNQKKERQILSIDSQIKEMLQIAERDGLEVVEIRRESHSAKNSSERPVFNSVITDIGEGRFNAILTWAPDRLSRNAGDLGSLVDLMDQKMLLEIRTYGQVFSKFTKWPIADPTGILLAEFKNPLEFLGGNHCRGAFPSSG